MTYLRKLLPLIDRVDKILTLYPSTRSSDARLYVTLLNYYHGVSYDDGIGEVFRRVHEGELPCFESVSRARRRVQEDGRNLPEPEVIEVRKELEKQVKEQINLI